MFNHKILFSIDMDEWYHARWCTGSEIARWPTTEAFFRDYYQSDRPTGEMVEPVHFILEVLDRFGVKGVFFALGEVATYYGDLLKEVVANGHEIGCHALHHKDMHRMSKDQFEAEVKEAKTIIENSTGQIVRAFRIPNAIIPEYLIESLRDLGFVFDSSLFPSRKFMGKYGYIRAPLHPYEVSSQNIEDEGNSGILEMPVAVDPTTRMLAGSGIITRVFGYWWSKAALRKLLLTGDTVYYFHPYELMPAPELNNLRFSQRVFLRNMGEKMRDYFLRLMQDFEGSFGTLDELRNSYDERSAGK